MVIDADRKVYFVQVDTGYQNGRLAPMQINVCEAPADAREETYRLLAQRAPARVLVDTSMPEGTWLVVRAPQPWEIERLTRETEAAHG